jgi:hypothetical protein
MARAAPARAVQCAVVINLTGDLPGAVEEGDVATCWRSSKARITAIRGSDATRARLLAEFRSGDYDAIHFAGHAWFDAAAPASSGILCAGGRLLSGADLAAMDSVPALVFFNACESGRLRLRRIPDPRWDRRRPSRLSTRTRRHLRLRSCPSSRCPRRP